MLVHRERDRPRDIIMTMKFIFSLNLILMFWAQTCYAGIRHQRVTWHENPSTEATISWTSDKKDESSVVYYDTIPKGGKINAYRYVLSPYTQGKYARGIFHRGPFYNHARLINLSPDTDYHFVIASDKAQTQELWFRTAPASKKNIRLLFGGDSRSDHDQRLVMNSLMKDLLEMHPEILALVHGGDYVNNGSSWPDWDKWLTHHSLTTTDKGRVLPIIPTRGNHEFYAKLFNQVWDWPNEGKSYYTTEIQDIAIITLNTEVSIWGDQRDWLETQLKSLNRDKKWIMANYHRPAFPAVKKPSTARDAWVPLFETYQVDMVFESDGHVYKQTAPIFKDKVDQERGIIYVGEGGLGVKQRTPKDDRWFLQNDSGIAMSAHHVQLVTIEENRLIYEGISEDGSVLGSIQLQPRPSRLND